METAQSIPLTKRIDWRASIFRILAGLVALFFLMISVTAALAPWGVIPADARGAQDPNALRWYGAVWFAYMSILVVGVLVVLVWRPRGRPLLMQFWLIGQILTGIVFITAQWPEVDASAPVIILVLLAAYPELRSLLRFKGESPADKIFIGLGVISTLVMVPVFWNSMQDYLSLTSEQSIGPLQVTYIAMLVPLAAFLVASKRPGWKAVAIVTGIALLYLGAAAVSTSASPGSWGVIGGTASLLGGLAFAGLAWKST